MDNRLGRVIGIRPEARRKHRIELVWLTMRQRLHVILNHGFLRAYLDMTILALRTANVRRGHVFYVFRNLVDLFVIFDLAGC